MGGRQLAFWGNFGTRNLGNECTLAAAIHHARRRHAADELLCVCPQPAEVERTQGIRAVAIGDARWRSARGRGLVRRLLSEAVAWGASFRSLAGTRALVLTGTGMLSDEGEGPFGFPYDLLRWVVCARLRGAEVSVLSVGVERLDRPLTRFFVRSAMRLARFRSFRDSRSRDRLTEAGLVAGSDPICPDLAFSLPPALLAAPPVVPGRSSTVAVGLYAFRDRGAAGEEARAAYRAYLEKICDLVVQLRTEGRRVRLIIGDNTYDEPVLADALEALARRGALDGETHPPATSYQEVLAQLASVDLVVASRFHNVLLALLVGRPVVSLSYESKNDSLMDGLGLGGFSAPIASFEVGWVLERLRTLERQGGPLMSAAAERMADYRRQLDAQYRRVFGEERQP